MNGLRLALAAGAIASLAACGSHSGAGTLPVTSSAAAAVAKVPASYARLGTYNIDPNRVYVAGFSTGGYFAVQMHVAHSATFKGAAIYAGGVYWCAGPYGYWPASCTSNYSSHLAQSEKYLDHQSSVGGIDNESNLSGQPVYLWSGTQDDIVVQAQMNDLDAEYQHYGVTPVYENAFAVVHGWESPDGEETCSTEGLPYMIHCKKGAKAYDSEKTWLHLLLGKLKPRNNGALKGTLINFDQTEFGASYTNSLDTNGYVYVPKACAAGQSCSLVLNLHGCTMTQANIGTKYIDEGGVEAWADTNKVIVLYPFTVANQSINPGACWDVWGYDDSSYALKSGTQISIIYAMVQRVTGRN